MANLEANFLGRGWSFPPTFNPNLHPKGVEMTTGLEDIERSLQILLTTRLNERILAPDFGCDLQDAVFQPLDTTLETRLKDLVSTAILYYEARIDLLNVTATEPPQQPGLLLIEVEFKVRATNARHNFVYPFYKQEGTELALSNAGPTATPVVR
ncbi:GPW/gp25 family protein [Hymenobacter cavernae]|uniref:Baseplate protein n=1 Tax=Hymenobacter cavernae TaxID=2044852 RepID=A0ABQ1UT67_9BACT|nr:GPW/gp25 family protein [Hymenobacter cavernae]GGF24403.1 baseplate protein [Hymenobacter cavernae]